MLSIFFFLLVIGMDFLVAFTLDGFVGFEQVSFLGLLPLTGSSAFLRTFCCSPVRSTFLRTFSCRSAIRSAFSLSRFLGAAAGSPYIVFISTSGM